MTYEEIKKNPEKAIDDEIAKNPSGHTILPEIRDVIHSLKDDLELAEKIQRAALRQLMKGNYQYARDILSTLENIKKLQKERNEHHLP